MSLITPENSREGAGNRPPTACSQRRRRAVNAGKRLRAECYVSWASGARARRAGAYQVGAPRVATGSAGSAAAQCPRQHLSTTNSLFVHIS